MAPAKTTQIKLLGDWLSNQDIPHIVTRQPGGTATGDRIRELLLNFEVRWHHPAYRVSHDVRRPRPGHS